jgi:hypothetical protein
MNAGTCWGKNTIDLRGRGVEKPRKATLTLTFTIDLPLDTTYSDKTLKWVQVQVQAGVFIFDTSFPLKM